MGRTLLRQDLAQHRADRLFLANVKKLSADELIALRFRRMKLWKRIAIERAIVRHWSSMAGVAESYPPSE